MLVLIKEDLEHIIIEKNSCYIFIKTKIPPYEIILGLIYFKPDFEMDYTLDKVQLVLDKCENFYPNTLVFLGGDFNVRLGVHDGILPPEALKDTILSPSRSSRYQIYTSRSVNSNYMSNNDFILLNGRSVGDSIGKMTYCGPNGASVIDLA